MTGRGHRLLGLAFGVASVPFLLPCGGFPAVALSMAGVLAGSTAPDWLEIRLAYGPRGAGTLIPHRTITHVLVLWLAMGACGLWLVGTGVLIGAPLFGFALGGLSHWIGDVGTPMGVPIWHPMRRFTINRWSDKTEMIPVLIAWCVAGMVLALTLTNTVHINCVDVLWAKLIAAGKELM